MAAFLTNADIPLPLADLLEADGHDVATARRLRLTSAPDDKMLLTAATMGRILLTHNERDFLLLQRAWLRRPVFWGVSTAPEHAGILALPQVPTVRYPFIVRAVGLFVAARPRPTNEMHAWRRIEWVPVP